MVLSELGIGKYGIVEMVKGEQTAVKRLSDMGFYPGAEVFCLYRHPLGDPTAFYVGEAVIALRRTTAEAIRIHPKHTHGKIRVE